MAQLTVRALIPAMVIVFLATGTRARAQNAPVTIQFEVASIRASAGDGRTAISVSPSGLYTVTNMPLRTLIRNAFGLGLDAQLAGVPEWVESARFDISAKAENPKPTVEHRRQMLQALLKERFKLVAHTESRELPVYSLVLARADGQLGPRLKRPAVDCDDLAARMQRGEVPPQRAGQPMFHGMSMSGGKLEIACMPLQTLIGTLMSSVQRPIVNRTGLSGNFNLALEWESKPIADGALPSIFVALQEQLGLKLEPGRGAVDVVVIDRIERPTLD